MNIKGRFIQILSAMLALVFAFSGLDMVAKPKPATSAHKHFIKPKPASSAHFHHPRHFIKSKPSSSAHRHPIRPKPASSAHRNPPHRNHVKAGSANNARIHTLAKRANAARRSHNQYIITQAKAHKAMLLQQKNRHNHARKVSHAKAIKKVTVHKPRKKRRIKWEKKGSYLIETNALPVLPINP